MKTHDNSLHFLAKNATLNEQGAGCYQHSDPSKADATFAGGHDMPFEHDIGDSTPKSKPEPKPTWQSLGDLARALAEKAGGK